MALSMITIHGNLGRDAELKTTPSGQTVANFSMAVTHKNRGEESTAWYRCDLWGKRGEALHPYLLKGKSFIVVGSLVPREYETNDGEKRMSLDVNVSEISFANGGGDEQAQPRNQESPRPAPALAADDDIPF